MRFVVVLALSLSLLLSSASWGAPACGGLFDRLTRALSTPSSSSNIINTNIRSVDWLVNALNSGERARLRTLDPFKDHNEFLSKMLTEAASLLKEDYARPESELLLVPHAEKLQDVILQDILRAQNEKAVTLEFYTKANAAIADLISLKNNSQGDVSNFNAAMARSQNVEEAVRTQYMQSQDKVDRSFRMLLNSGLTPLPVFAELKMRDFLYLGMEIAPLGMTLNAKTSYDGVRDDTASALFMHDISHALVIHIRKVGLTPNELVELEKINRFLKDDRSYSHLTQSERRTVESYLFNVIHEDANVRQLIRGFSQKDFYRTSIGIYSTRLVDPESTVYRSYDRLNDKEVNFEYDLNMPYSMYAIQVRDAVSKFVDNYFKNDQQ